VLTFFKKQVYYLFVYFKGTGAQIPFYTRNCDWVALGTPDSSVTATGRVQHRLNTLHFAWEGLTDFSHKTGNFGIQTLYFPGLVEKAGERLFICEFQLTGFFAFLFLRRVLPAVLGEICCDKNHYEPPRRKDSAQDKIRSLPPPPPHLKFAISKIISRAVVFA
jgi:hypothetical protein